MTLVGRYLVLVLVLVLLLFSCTRKENSIFLIEGKTQGTFYTIKYFSSSKKINKNNIDSVLTILDMSMSSYIDSSNISRINDNYTIKIDTFLNKVVSRSLSICNQTDGAFDITIAPIVNAYGFGPKSSDFNFKHLDQLGCDALSIDNGIINKKHKSIELDVNGIAQGYSVDVLSEYLKNNNIFDFIINIGGEVYCSGSKNKKPWLVAIEKPYQNIQLQKYILKLSNKALATSGSYRKIKNFNGKIISHTMSPKTLKPVENNLLSVSIMTDNCMDADAYATACMSMGLNKSIQFVNENNIEACFVYVGENDTLTYMTSGMLGLVSSDSPDYSDLQTSFGAAPQ